MEILTTNAMVEQLVNALCDQSAARRSYLIRQSLLALVRLAKIEYQTEIKKDVERATRLTRSSASRRITKRLLGNISSASGIVQQRRLKFD